MTEEITTDIWQELGKLVEMVRDHKVKSLETKLGPYKIKIYRIITTIRIDLQEIGEAK